jgi:hypothetical protein
MRSVLAGAAAGLLATWVMDRVTTAWYNAQSPAVRRLEDNTRGGATAYALAAERTAQAFGRDVSRETRDKLGNGIHWVLGATTGAVYGALRPHLASSHVAWGLAFGTLWWLVVDEAATSALHLTAPPRAFPWQTHARGLAGHLAFGAVTDRALAAVERIAG